MPGYHRDVAEKRTEVLITRPAVTAAAVRDAALTLFAARGYHGTALSDIAERLGIKVPSLYNHMDSKQQLLADIITATTDAVWADFRLAIEDEPDPAEALRKAVYAYALRHACHRRAAIIVHDDVAHLEEPTLSSVLEKRRAHERGMREVLDAGVAKGAFTVVHSRMASFAILEMCVSIARWFRDDGPMTAEEVAEAYSMYASAIAGARSRRRGARKERNGRPEPSS